MTELRKTNTTYMLKVFLLILIADGVEVVQRKMYSIGVYRGEITVSNFAVIQAISGKIT